MAEETLKIETPDGVALASKSVLQLQVARSFSIVDDDTYQLAGEELKAIRKRVKDLEEQRLGITRPMDEAKERVMTLFREPVAKLNEAAGVLNTAMVTYHEAKAKLAEEERRKAEEAARVEREKLAAAARAAEEEAKKMREAAAKTDGVTAQQSQLEAAAKETEARNLAAAAVMVTAAVPAASAPVSTGAGTSKTWKVEVVSLIDLVKWVCAHPEEIGLLKADETALNAKARSMKENFNVDGVRASPVTTMRSTR